jgi:deoxyuridine 5'-triphosphate nucleotidohydrolase
MNVIGKKLKNKMSDKQLLKTHRNDAGLDICCSEEIIIPAKSSAIVNTDLYIEVPYSHVGMIKSRSGLSVKHQLEVGAGIIDSGYRSEVKVHLYNHSNINYTVEKGDKIAQLLTIPVMLNLYEESETLSDSSRGENGFGSTGK